MKGRREYGRVHLLLVILLLTSTVSYVFGNAGPPMMGPSGEKLIFDEDSGVALKEEWVTIDLTSEEEGTVEVRYHLENLHRETEDLEMLFILPRASDFTELFWNGEAVEEISERPYDQLPTNWSTAGDLTVREPLSGDAFDGDQYDYGRFSTMDGYKGLAFTVTLPEGETGELRLRYPSYSGYFRSSEIMSTAVQLVNPVHYKIYYLSRAAFGKGMPKPIWSFASLRAAMQSTPTSPWRMKGRESTEPLWSLFPRRNGWSPMPPQPGCFSGPTIRGFTTPS